MPLVISHKAQRTFYVRDEGGLGEVLGHSDFDGEDWAIGDVIIFEDGTRSVIEIEQHEKLHVWSNPEPTELGEVLTLIRDYDDPRVTPAIQIDSWAKLFHAFTPPPKKSWWREFLKG